MKKSNKLLTATAVILSLCSAAFFVMITYSFFHRENFEIHLLTMFEKEGYLLCGLAYLATYSLLIRYINSSKQKILLAFAAGAVCTVQVFLLNNLWHYISFNETFNWVDAVGYTDFLIHDLSYTENGQFFKYPQVFALIFSSCFFVAFLLRPILNFYEEIMFGECETSETATEEVTENDN